MSERDKFRAAFDVLAEHYETATGKPPKWVAVYGKAFPNTRRGLVLAYRYWQSTKPEPTSTRTGSAWTR